MREKYNGVIIINKEAGFTSHDVVAKLRGILGQRRIGHTGTLDPDATGVLPVCVGNATKLCDMLTDKSKAYKAVLLLGIRTDTQDMSGSVLENVRTQIAAAHEAGAVICAQNYDAQKACGDEAEEDSSSLSFGSDADGESGFGCGNGAEENSSGLSFGNQADGKMSLGFRFGRDEIVSAAKSFIGEYMQQPPMYSAVKINGKRLYELARKGIEVERKLRSVCIDSIEVENICESDGHVEVTMQVECSKGTYIRTLCNDIGEKLGCGGCMKLLERTRVGEFSLEQSLTLSQIQELAASEKIETAVLPTDSCLHDYGKGQIKEEADRLLMSGNMLGMDDFESLECENHAPIRVYDSHGEFMATYVYSERFKSYKPEKMFL